MKLSSVHLIARPGITRLLLPTQIYPERGTRAKKVTFYIVSSGVCQKYQCIHTNAGVNDVISIEIYLPLYSNSQFWPEDWKRSVNEKFICIKIRYNTRPKILSNCTCKILLNTCSDYLLEMRWGKNLLNMPAWKWTKHSNVLLSHWPIFTKSFNYLDIILLILQVQSIPHIILNTLTFLCLSLSLFFFLASNCFSTEIPFKRLNRNPITARSIILTVKDSVPNLPIKVGNAFQHEAGPFTSAFHLCERS